MSILRAYLRADRVQVGGVRGKTVQRRCPQDHLDISPNVKTDGGISIGVVGDELAWVGDATVGVEGAGTK